MEMKNVSWLRQTKQHWKVWVFLSLIVLSLALFVLFVWRVNVPSPGVPGLPDQVTLSFCFVMSGIVSLCWLWLSVRCPVCKARVAGHILKAAPAGVWFTTLLALERCPLCGGQTVNPSCVPADQSSCHSDGKPCGTQVFRQGLSRPQRTL